LLAIGAFSASKEVENEDDDEDDRRGAYTALSTSGVSTPGNVQGNGPALKGRTDVHQNKGERLRHIKITFYVYVIATLDLAPL
jgi:hypothetical protein